MINLTQKEMKEFDSKTWVLGLLVSCPLGEPHSDCPLNYIRNKSYGDKLEFIDQLSDEKQEAILMYHEMCLSVREQKL